MLFVVVLNTHWVSQPNLLHFFALGLFSVRCCSPQMGMGLESADYILQVRNNHGRVVDVRTPPWTSWRFATWCDSEIGYVPWAKLDNFVYHQ